MFRKVLSTLKVLPVVSSLIALCLLIAVPAAAQTQSATEPDRSAEDFVTASICIADPTDWRDDVLGVSGHAFIRLQCPTYSLDYCFSYEGERVSDNFFRYLTGATKMGMFAIPTGEYLQDYRTWNRTVREYQLHLPPEVETRLWEIMDNHLTNGITLTQDMNKYGCAITIVRYVKKALNGIPIIYAPSDFDHLTRREIGYRSMRNYPWIRFFSMLFTDSRYDRECPIDEKLIFPADLATVWQNATINGNTLATYSGELVTGAALDNTRPWFTPMLLAVLLLVITLAFCFTRYPYWNYLMLASQSITGLLLIALWFIMDSYSTSSYLLFILFNPLPLILWKWRKYWALPYAALLLIWVIVIALLPHMIIDPSLLVLALSYIAIFAKEGLPLIRK